MNEMRRMSDPFCADVPLAMAYVPMQKWQKLYDPDVALERGTLFLELDKPFIG
ncbi:MAG: spore coat associated protein CotJA, partial [Oscillospiraceae bacterium]